MISIKEMQHLIPLEIIPRRFAAWVTAWNHSRGDRNTPREFLTGFIRRVRGDKRFVLLYVLVAIASVAFFAYAFFPWATSRKMPIKFNSPDETANYVFASRVARGQPFGIPEALSGVAGGVIHPRSTRAVNDTIVPTSFLGLPLLYGTLGWLIGVDYLPYITPFVAAIGLAALYGCWRRLYDEKTALMAIGIAAAHPALWYYAARGFYHNVLFVCLLTFAWWFYFNSRERNFRISYFITAILFAAIALFVRTSEVLWVVPLVAVMLWHERARLTSRHLLAMIVTAGLCTVIGLVISISIFGQSLVGGYIPAVASSATSSLGRVVARLGAVLLPFGFHPINLVINFLRYGVILFLPWWLLVAAGLIGAQRRHYIWAVGGVTAWLLVYYGSWQFSDTVGPGGLSVGASYVRYWLPIYILWLPYAAIGLNRLANTLSLKFSRVWLCLMYLLMAFFSFGLVFFEPNEGLVAVAGRLERYRETARFVTARTSPAAIVLGDRADKLFFPERRVIATDGRPVLTIPEVQRALPALALAAPLYYYTTDPLNHDSVRGLDVTRFALANSWPLSDGAWLYRLVAF